MDYDQFFPDQEVEEEEVTTNYTLEETVQIGQDYVDAYNSGLNFTMVDPVIEVDTSGETTGGHISGPNLGLKIGLIGGGSLLVVGLIVFLIIKFKR